MFGWFKKKAPKQTGWNWHSDQRVKFVGHVEIQVGDCAPIVVHSHDFVQFLEGVMAVNRAYRSAGHDVIVDIDRRAKAFVDSLYANQMPPETLH